MNDCPTCGYPMVVSDDKGREWCSVYGDHRPTYSGRNVVLDASPIGAAIRAEIDSRRKGPHRQGNHMKSTPLSRSDPQPSTRTMVA